MAPGRRPGAQKPSCERRSESAAPVTADPLPTAVTRCPSAGNPDQSRRGPLDVTSGRPEIYPTVPFMMSRLPHEAFRRPGRRRYDLDPRRGRRRRRIDGRRRVIPAGLRRRQGRQSENGAGGSESDLSFQDWSLLSETSAIPAMIIMRAIRPIIDDATR
jgi:hypothetical protein